MQSGLCKFIMVAALAAFAASPAWAWGRDGHRIVCAVAWDDLTPAAKTRIADMINVEDRDAFAESCNWADNYTFFHKETQPWHFVNVPPDATSADLARDCPNGVCVIEKIETEIRVLRDRSTAEPARIMGYEGTVGTLKPGANADISVFELRDGAFELRDSDGDTITAKRRLLAQMTVKDGRVWYERPAG